MPRCLVDALLHAKSIVSLAQKRLGPFSALRCYEATVECEPQTSERSAEDPRHALNLQALRCFVVKTCQDYVLGIEELLRKTSLQTIYKLHKA